MLIRFSTLKFRYVKLGIQMCHLFIQTAFHVARFQVERTKDRPLPAGQLSLTQAFAFLGAQLSLSLGILLQFSWYRSVRNVLNYLIFA